MIPNLYMSNQQLTAQLYLKPEYKNHRFISGNKYRKLKYNLVAARDRGLQTLVTFGGAYSNHIAAVAAAGKAFGFKTIGVIRGDELARGWGENPTLDFAAEQGMQFHFVSRTDYREKNSSVFIEQLKSDFGEFYLIPEGGTNAEAVKGCTEILGEADAEFDIICCPVGTGGTISGIIEASLDHQKVLGFPALKGDFLKKDIAKFTSKTNWELIPDYHFGGYAKIKPSLIEFINKFKKTYDVPLDPVYTGKMMYGVEDMIQRGMLSKTAKILVIHTGGLQGISGMNRKLKAKGQLIIE